MVAVRFEGTVMTVTIVGVSVRKIVLSPYVVGPPVMLNPAGVS